MFSTEYLKALDYVLRNPLENLISSLKSKGNCTSEWAEQIILLLVQECASISAFPKLLELQTFSDFKQHFPIITKENYVNLYKLNERSRPGQTDFIHFSSGTSGVPTAWGRSSMDELSISVRFEQIFKDVFQADTVNTLALLAFPLGSWVGGIFTLFATRYLSLKGHKITLVTPGNNPPEIFNVVNKIGADFDQIIILGYPPFVKQLIDSFNFKRFQVGIVLAGEVFSEEWRNLVAARCGCDFNRIVSIYGTSDAGVLANETSLTITIRRILNSDPAKARLLFKSNRLPSLMQYDPMSRYFEEQEGKLILTAMPLLYSEDYKQCIQASTAAPLVRYSINDSGGIMPLEDMVSFIRAHYDASFSLQGRMYHNLPILWVFGRASWTVSMYGANVYVEHIMAGLEMDSISSFVTSKFVLDVSEDDDGKRLKLAGEIY
jgi:phenylacetate-CoA ligase